MTAPYAYIHDKCGKPAFLFSEEPAFGSRYSSEIARHLDGSQMECNAAIVCETCGEPVIVLKRECIQKFEA